MKNLLGTLTLLAAVAMPAASFAQTPTPTPAAAEPDDPNQKKIGIGAGWVFGGADLLTPNTVSARFVLKNKMVIEPMVQASITQGFEHQHVTIGDNRPHQAARDYFATVGFGVQVRKPVATRGPIQYLVIASPTVVWNDAVDNPFGPDNRIFTSQTIWGLGYGIGVEYFPTKFEGHWSLSMDALNPLFAFTYTSTYDQSANFRTNTTNYFLGAVFDPAVRGMLHLYY